MPSKYEITIRKIKGIREGEFTETNKTLAELADLIQDNKKTIAENEIIIQNHSKLLSSQINNIKSSLALSAKTGTDVTFNTVTILPKFKLDYYALRNSLTIIDTTTKADVGLIGTEGIISYMPGTGECAVLRPVTGTATRASICPDYNDTNTGIGHAAADSISFITGEIEAYRITEASNLIAHSLTGIVKTPSTQNVTGTPAGIIDITTTISLVTTSGGATDNNFSLADGAEGQDKYIVLVAGGGGSNLIVTPTNLWNGTTITFIQTSIGLSCHLKFAGGKWAMVGGDSVKA